MENSDDDDRPKDVPFRNLEGLNAIAPSPLADEIVVQLLRPGDQLSINCSSAMTMAVEPG
jgi:hypothetical protein